MEVTAVTILYNQGLKQKTQFILNRIYCDPRDLKN